MGITQYQLKSWVSAQAYLDSSLALSKEIHYQRGIMQSYEAFAELYEYQGEFSTSLDLQGIFFFERRHSK